MAAARGGSEAPSGAESAIGVRSAVVRAIRRSVFADRARTFASTPFQVGWVAA